MKKTIKQQVREVEKQILLENDAFYQEMMATHFPQSSSKKRKPIMLIASALSSFIVVFVVVLSVLFLLPEEVPDPTKHYMLENEKSRDATLEQMQIDFPEIRFTIGSAYGVQIKCVYDSVYDDTLYYVITLTLEDILETIKIQIYTNKDYELKNDFPSGAAPATVNGIIFYHVETILDIGGIYEIKRVAWFEEYGKMVFIDYEQYAFDGQGNFFHFIEETFQKAN